MPVPGIPAVRRPRGAGRGARRPLATGWARVLFAVLGMIAGCSDDPPTGPAWPLGPHRLLHGQLVMPDGTPATLYGVAVVGRRGSMVTAQGPDSLGRYIALVDDLEPPYLIWNSIGLAAVVTDTGVANVSLLTHLQALEVLRADPGAVFGQATEAGDHPALAVVTPAAVAAAQAAAASLVAEEYGLSLDLTGLDVVRTPFTVVPGNPMADLLSAAAGLGIDPYGYSTARAEEFARCRLARVAVALPVGARELCPLYKEAAPDPGDPSLVTYRFINARGDTLSATALGGAITALTYVRAGPLGSFSCSGAGCSGASITGLPTDTLRPLVLATAVLAGAAGQAQLDGALATADPTWQPPVILCDTIGTYTVRLADGSYPQGCSYSYVKQLYGGRQYYEVGFDAYDAVIIARDTQVLSVTHHVFDGSAANWVPVHRCTGAACTGVTISAADARGRRTLLLDRTPLPAVDSLGTPTGTDTALVRAVVHADGYSSGSSQGEVPDPAVCAIATDTVQVTIPGEAGWTLCVQPNNPAFETTYKYWGDNFDGTWSYVMSGTGTGALTFLTTPGDSTITGLNLALLVGEFWRCADPACPGVTLQPPDSNGVASVTFTNAVLEELEFVLPSGRTAILNGTVRDIHDIGSF